MANCNPSASCNDCCDGVEPSFVASIDNLSSTLTPITDELADIYFYVCLSTECCLEQLVFDSNNPGQFFNYPIYELLGLPEPGIPSGKIELLDADGAPISAMEMNGCNRFVIRSVPVTIEGGLFTLIDLINYQFQFQATVCNVLSRAQLNVYYPILKFSNSPSGVEFLAKDFCALVQLEQQGYYLDNGNFASNLSQLGLSIPSSISGYYSIIVNTNNSIAGRRITYTSLSPNLSSAIASQLACIICITQECVGAGIKNYCIKALPGSGICNVNIPQPPAGTLCSTPGFIPTGFSLEPCGN